MKYKSKPKIIEAMELTRARADVVVGWIKNNHCKIQSFNLGEFIEDSCYIEIETFEGVMTANEGDYIIKGIVNEFYPCKPDVFHKSYELITDEI
jgi:hypothetical protein